MKRRIGDLDAAAEGEADPEALRRIYVVKMAKLESVQKSARFFNISEGSVRDWVGRFDDEGVDGLSRR